MEFILELALVAAAVRVHGVAIAMSSVHVPLTLILGQNTVGVPLAVIDLEAVPVSDLLEINLKISLGQRCHFGVLSLGD